MNQYLKTIGPAGLFCVTHQETEVIILQPRAEARLWIPILGIASVFQKLMLSLPWNA